MVMDKESLERNIKGLTKIRTIFTESIRLTIKRTSSLPQQHTKEERILEIPMSTLKTWISIKGQAQSMISTRSI